MKKILIFISIFLVLSACSKLEDLNVNTKAYTSAPAGALVNGTVRSFFNQMATFNVNNNNTELFVQHFAETTYPDESHYDMVTRTIPGNHMNTLYRNVLMNLKEAAKIYNQHTPLQDGITQGHRDNQLALIEILSVYAWSNIVETFGDMPYSEALDVKYPSPKYDDGLGIYKDLISRLEAAVAAISTTDGMTDGYDNIYGDDPASWKKFGNSLLLRMGLMLADKDAATSVAAVNSAIAGGVFGAGDKFSLNYLSASPNQNPVYTELVVSGRSDFVVTSILVDPMNTLNDPRRDLFMWTKVAGVYKGGLQGKANSYANFTHVDNAKLTSEREVVLMDYCEVEFLLAEAAARTGYTGAGVAATHYANAVTASITNWGGTAGDAATYLAQPGVDYATLIAGGQSWKQVIGTQAWFAYYMRGFSAWTTWRRLDYPRLIATTDHVDDVKGIPYRYIYPVSEQTLNNANYTTAATAIGGDNAMTALFWDTVHYDTLTGL